MYNTKSVIDMSVFDDIMKKSNAPSNIAKIQSAATNIAEPAVNATGAVAGTGAKALGTVADGATTVAPATNAATATQAPAARPQQLSYVDMLNKMYTPETAEEKAKRERKEKWDKTAAAIGDGISALANLYYTTKGAPNSYDGKNSMSERTRQLYDKLDKDRKENDRWYLNHYMNAAKMDEEAKRYADERDYKRGRDKVADDRYEDNKNYARGRDAANDKFRNEGREHDWQRQAERDAAQDANTQWQHQFQEKQADRAQSNANRSYQLQKDAYKRQLDKENPTIGFALGNGQKANIKKQNINAQNVSYVYNKLPKEVRDQYAMEPVYDKNTGMPLVTYEDGAKVPVTKARKLTQDDMMVIIGEHIANYPDVQNAWKEVGGEITTSTQQQSGDNTPPSRVKTNNTANDNTPPSRQKK